MTAKRPIEPHDFARIRALIQAFEVKFVDGEEEPLWEALRGVHAQYLSEDPPMPLDDLVGDKAVSRELAHAGMVLECLMHEVSEIPVTPVTPATSRCAEGDCDNLTYGTQCAECELLGPKGGRS